MRFAQGVGGGVLGFLGGGLTFKLFLKEALSVELFEEALDRKSVV